MARTLKDYWYEVYQYGYHTRTYEPQRGLEKWQFYKNTYSSIPDKFETSTSYKKLFDSVGYTPAGSDDNDSTIQINNQVYNNNIEKFHFLVQLFRIPKLAGFNLPFIKALQLAYNAGQLQATIDKGEYEEELVEFVKNNRLIEVPTYFDDPDKKVNSKVGSCDCDANSIGFAHVLIVLLFLILIYYVVKFLGETFTGFGSSFR
jgi:hypothetical protein